MKKNKKAVAALPDFRGRLINIYKNKNYFNFLRLHLLLGWIFIAVKKKYKIRELKPAHRKYVKERNSTHINIWYFYRIVNREF